MTAQPSSNLDSMDYPEGGAELDLVDQLIDVTENIMRTAEAMEDAEAQTYTARQPEYYKRAEYYQRASARYKAQYDALLTRQEAIARHLREAIAAASAGRVER